MTLLRDLEKGDLFTMEGTPSDVLCYHGPDGGLYGRCTLFPESWGEAKRNGTELLIYLKSEVYKYENHQC